MLLPFLFLISASFLLPGYGEVVSSFDNCGGFFFNGRFPNDALTPSNPACICQKYESRYVFATMYDRTRRIPIYSAYVYNPKAGQRATDWMIEPQLANNQYGPDMEDERETAIPVAEIEASQATFNDYKAAPYYVDKGHLNPVAHQSDPVSKAATFTLTNIVPQFNRLNQRSWKDYETETMARKNAEFKCTKIYVITGAVPGDTSIAGGRVNYPSRIWSAACCVIDANKRESWGAIADNNWQIPPDVIPPVTERTLQQLEQDLTSLYGAAVDLFGGSCN
ncbi:PREDICTED: endonuclease domain-containing 1 protein-like [Gekko japonicus]|uniref:Endonuclease domain-containing 1 protein-like n=1 Tax=Gekko japonicus TaxID=146911 RepID=A0ABM1L2P7_GEKJA|nr:PREDICTED: endonuclease domain-containing 1 protein-like [Gekko japonicus]